MFEHDLIEFFNSFCTSLLEYKLDHVVPKHIFHQACRVPLLIHYCSFRFLLARLWCCLFLEKLLFIITNLFIEGIYNGKLCALTTAQLHLDELGAELVPAQLADITKHFLEQSFSDLRTALTALMPNIILEAAFNSRPCIDTILNHR